MLYHLLNSDEERLGNRLVEAQEESGFEQCWFAEVKKEAQEIGIVLKSNLEEGSQREDYVELSERVITFLFTLMTTFLNTMYILHCFNTV